MRRFALTVLASVSIAVLAGCSGYGGSAIGNGSSNNPDRLVFQTLGGLQGVYKVAPAATTPLVVSVYGVKSSFAITQFDTTAAWSTTYSTGTYTNPNPTAGLTNQTACPAVPPGSVDPSKALVMFNPDGSISTYTAGTYTQSIGILPTNLAGAPASYCLTVAAKTTGGTIGTFTAFVGN